MTAESLFLDVFANTNGVASKCAIGVSVVHSQMYVCYGSSDGIYTEGIHLCKRTAHCCPQMD